MKQNYKTLITYASIIFGVVAITWWIIAYAQTKQEPIQEILNQIQMNESELQRLEIKQNELNQWNAMLKEELFVKYWLEISEKQGQSPDDSEICPLELFEKYEWDCVNHLDDWTPWKLSEDGTHQEMPEVDWSTEHEKFKNLAWSYWLDASQIRTVENHYGIKEWVILCITVAETSWWNRWYGEKNIWSVGSNDRGDRPTYALMEAWLEDIGKVLNNKYLWSKKTLWCLSNAWSCKESNDNGKRYATSESSWEKNMVACLSTIYWSVDASTFTIRR